VGGPSTPPRRSPRNLPPMSDKGAQRYSRKPRRPIKVGGAFCYKSGAPGAAQAATQR